MTGSALNNSNGGIMPGMALAETAQGVDLASPGGAAAFALATDGAPSRGIVSYTTEGVVERRDWTALAGSRLLAVGQTYYVGPNGTLSASGSQPVGRAQSGTVLRVSVGAVAAAAASAPANVPAIIYGQGPPYQVGVDGQMYVDTTRKQWYGPRQDGVWPGPWLTS